MSEVIGFLLNKWRIPKEPTASFAGKTVLVTGANVGLGYEAAKKYLVHGCTDLILAVRTPSKGEKAKDQMLSETGKQTAKIQIWQLDMSSFKSVQEFADRVSKEIPKLDVALLNAGVFQSKYVCSSDGWEEVLQVNYLSTILLGLLLLPKLRETKTKTGEIPYLDFVSSASHRGVSASGMHKSKESGHILEYWNQESHFSPGQTYGRSKLLLEYAKVAMADLPLVRDPNGELSVIVNSCCPGFCKSNIPRNVTKGSAMWSFLVWFGYAVFARTTEEGSRTLVSSTTIGEESHGKWWSSDTLPPDSERGTMMSSSEGKEISKLVWNETLKVLVGIDPRVKEIVSPK